MSATTIANGAGQRFNNAKFVACFTRHKQSSAIGGNNDFSW
jgi:hypothetical protein